MDNLTKFVKLYPSKTVQSRTVVGQLKTFALTYGLPKRIITDRGMAFQSECFRQYCEVNGIHHHSVSVRHPRANGQVERVNSTLLTVIATRMREEATWDKELIELELALNTAPNQTTGVSPFYAIYGYDALVTDGLLDTLTNVLPVYRQPAVIQQELHKRIVEKQANWKKQHDKHRKQITLEVGEIVFLRRPPVSIGYSTKLQPKFRGPLVVTAVKAGDTYKLADLHHSKGHLYATTAHISALKRFVVSQEDREEENNSESEVAESDDQVCENDTTTDKDQVEDYRPPEADKDQQRSVRTHKRPAYLSEYVTH